MKYYLHDSNAFNDEKITQLFTKFGYEGLGLFYTLLEKIASQEKPIKTDVLKFQLKVGKKLEKCWKFMEEIELIYSNNGDTFNEQLLNFSEKYAIKKEKNRKKISEWREKQNNIKSVTSYEPVSNLPKVKLSKVKKSKKNIADKSAYVLCVEIYDKFCKSKINAGAIIDGTQGKALKSIISYLEKNIKVQPADDKSITDAFKYIFDHFDKWDDFHKKQIKLSQISSNLLNILNSIKDAKNKTKKVEDKY